MNKATMLWHWHLGHPHAYLLKSIMDHLHVPFTERNKVEFCETCQFGKLHQGSFPSSPTKSTSPFELILADVWGSTPISYSTGFSYYLLFVDDFSRYS